MSLRIPKLVQHLVFLNTFVEHCACGFQHMAALVRGGSVYTWGWNKRGQLGHVVGADKKAGRQQNVFAKVPQRMEQLAEIVSVDCGFEMTAFVDSKQNLHVVGQGLRGQLGLGKQACTWEVLKVKECCGAVLSVCCAHDFTTVVTQNNGIVQFGNSRDIDEDDFGVPCIRVPVTMKNEAAQRSSVTCSDMLSAFNQDGQVVYWNSSYVLKILPRTLCSEDTYAVGNDVFFTTRDVMLSCQVTGSFLEQAAVCAGSEITLSLEIIAKGPSRRTFDNIHVTMMESESRPIAAKVDLESELHIQTCGEFMDLWTSKCQCWVTFSPTKTGQVHSMSVDVEGSLIWHRENFGVVLPGSYVKSLFLALSLSFSLLSLSLLPPK